MRIAENRWSNLASQRLVMERLNRECTSSSVRPLRYRRPNDAESVDKEISLPVDTGSALRFPQIAALGLALF